MDERADGFWWVKHGLDEDPRWMVVDVDTSKGVQFWCWPGLDTEFRMDDPEIIVWGPYLGTEPGEVLP